MLKELKTQHRQILRYRSQGLRPVEIADKVGMKVGSVHAVLRDPLAKSFLSGLQDRIDEGFVDVTKSLAELSIHAVDVMKDLVTLPEVKDQVRLAAAKDILDRNGHKPPEKHLHAVGHFTADDLAKLQDRAETVDTSYLDVIDVTESASSEESN